MLSCFFKQKTVGWLHKLKYLTSNVFIWSNFVDSTRYKLFERFYFSFLYQENIFEKVSLSILPEVGGNFRILNRAIIL